MKKFFEKGTDRDSRKSTGNKIRYWYAYITGPLLCYINCECVFAMLMCRLCTFLYILYLLWTVTLLACGEEE